MRILTSRQALRWVASSALLLSCGVGHATWSIVAVDPKTREVGLAAATCNLNIQFIAAVVPGAGVVAAQAGTSFKGRDQAVEWMADGVGAQAILQRLSDAEFYGGWFYTQFPDLQYGVATLIDGPEAGYVGGDDLVPWHGGKSGPTYSVQGNMLRGEDVVAEAERAFGVESLSACRLTLGDRLLRALEAGRDAGGDVRCSRVRPAQSAMLATARAPDLSGTKEEVGPSLRIVIPRETTLLHAAYSQIFPDVPDEDAAEPVQALREKFEKLGGRRCRAPSPPS